MNRLRDRVCIVTGAARGIGKGIARRFLEEGARVWICDLSAEAVEAAVADLTALGPIAGGVTDVSQRDQVEAMVAAVVEAWGRVDVLVNNAGVAQTAAFLEIEDAEWDRIMETNLRGTFLCSQVATRQMVAQGKGGAIVNIASTNGLRGQPMLAAYGASKAGVINLSLTAALELGAHAIRVNALCPGTIWTELSARAGWSDELWAEIISHTALGRFGYPQDIAAAAAYLASDDASFVTGAVLVVDGGLTARQLNIAGERLRHQPTESD
jgi:NAD(P)-dependent dehydrogenase (short-subunit alcohol dehydrogenase family)